VLAGVAALLAPGAEAVVLVSVVPRDGLAAIPAAGDLRGAYAHHCLELVEVREATAAEVAASRSSWAKRLRAGAARPVMLLRARAPASLNQKVDDRRRVSLYST
jgi:16S rRNA (adenine(1408)-N(1))-methyltransferase